MGSIMLTDMVTVAMVGSFSIWHWLIVLAVVLVLFGGGGKIPRLMKDLGSGIKQFKHGMKEEEETTAESKAIEDETGTTTAQTDKATASSSKESKKAVNG